MTYNQKQLGTRIGIYLVRSTVIIGNGIGQALDSEYFSLSRGLECVWSSTDHLSMGHKSLIISAITEATIDAPPSSEKQLDKLQLAIVAIEYLNSFTINDASWVTEPAQELPQAFKKFVHEVALHFHRSAHSLPDDFTDPLSDFIARTKSHIATLNYDNLLYDALLASGVLDGYSGSLIDGFQRSGFDEDNMDRFNTKRFGWYMHLHGSPLYIGNRKAMGIHRDFLDPDENSHIVLTHVEHKKIIIESSPILSTYWRRLDKAIRESKKIIIFGYSGLDTHLNERVQSYKNEKELLVVEWSGEGTKDERIEYWKEVTHFDNLSLVQLDNILEFVDW